MTRPTTTMIKGSRRYPSAAPPSSSAATTRTGFSVAASTILTDAIPEVQSGAQGSRAQPARPFYPWLTFDYG